MATSAAEIEFVPDDPIEFVPDEPAGAVAPAIEFIPDVPDEVVAQEAQRATAGALQTLDVMRAPQQFDWSGVRSDIDTQRLQEARAAEAQALLAEEQGSGTGPGSDAYNWRREADFQRGRINPDTAAGQTLRAEGAQELQNLPEGPPYVEPIAPAENLLSAFESNVKSEFSKPLSNELYGGSGKIGGRTPSEAISSFLGPGLSSTVMPVIDSAGRSVGAATGGAGGAALAALATVGTAGWAPLALGIGGALLGAYAGGAAQEEILKTTETEEETAARNQRAAEDTARNPWATRIGAMAASSPFFGPSLAQFGRAIYGDRGAMANLGIAGAIGGGIEKVSAAIQGRELTAEDVISGVLGNMLMNEPTRLGRRLGFQPSSEQAAVENGQKYQDLPPQIALEGQTSIPVRQDLESGLTTEAAPTPAAGDVFAGVPRQPPEVLPVEAAPVAPEVVPAEAAPIEATPPVPVEEATAATASEAPADLPGATSNKNAVVNAERAMRGVDPVLKEEAIANPESIKNAIDVVTQNPNRAKEIVAELNSDNPQERTISLENEAVMMVERAKLNRTRNELLARSVDDNLSPTERAVASEQFAATEAELLTMDQAADRAGATWGRYGQLRQRMIRDDFSLENLPTRARKDKGDALSPEEATKVAKIAENVKAAEDAVPVAKAEVEAAQSEAAVDQVIKDIAAKPDADPAVRSLADRIIANLDTRAEAARKRLRERFQKLGSAPDPLIVADFIDLAASRLGRSSIKAGQWITEMVKEFGEGVRPYLQAAWDAADKQLDKAAAAATGDKKKRAAAVQKIKSVGEQQDRILSAIGARVQEGESLPDMGRYVDKLVDTFVAGGVRDRNALVSSVKGALEPIVPGLTDMDVTKLVSKYGKHTLPSTDPIKVEAARMKGELLQVAKLNDLLQGKPAEATGPQHRKKGDEERRLVKEVNAAKKAAKIETTDPKTQLKSAQDSARTRAINDIKDLTFEIETGTKPANRTQVEYDQDIQILRGIKQRLQEVEQFINGNKQLTPEQINAARLRGVQESIKGYEDIIAGKQKPGKGNVPDSPEVTALKAKRDELKARAAEIEASDSLLAENRKAEALVRSIVDAEATLAGAVKPGKVQGPESALVAEAKEQLAAVREAIQAKNAADPAVQRAKMDAAEAAVEKAIKKLDEQIQSGDVTAQRQPSPAASQRLEDLRLQRDAMTKLRNQLRAEARPRPDPLAVAIKQRLSTLKRQEADYAGRVARSDFGPRPRKGKDINVENDPRVLDALANVQREKDQYAKLQEQWKKDQMNPIEKGIFRAWQAWEASKNAALSFDLSAPLQNAFAMAAHPIEGVKAIGKGVRAFAEQFALNSDKFAKREEQRTINSENYKNGAYRDGGLDLSVGGKHEENAGSVLEKLADLDSRWAGIPDIIKGLWGLKGKQIISGGKQLAKAIPKVYGMGIKASNAGFNAIANHMRTRTFDAILARWYKRGGAAPTKEQLKLIGDLVNVATGKGGLKGEKGLRAIFFAPNYYLSIIKQLTAQPVLKAGVKMQGKVMREGFEEYARAIATLGMLQGLQWLFGNRDEQTYDPRDPNFAKAKTENGSTVDFTMGRGSWVNAATQIATGERVNKQGRLEDINRFQALWNFTRGRLSREITTGLTIPFGKSFSGKDKDRLESVQEMLVPLSWRDVDQVLEKEGLTRGAFIQMLNMLGVTSRLSE